MLLAIDRGNTKDKFVVFDGENIVCDSAEIITENNLLVSDINKLVFNTNFTISACIFSSVKDKQSDEVFVSELSKLCKIFSINHNTKLSFTNAYQSNTLGQDRICLVAGAKARFGKSVLVIDAGTCITFDYLDETNTYRGGSICPGMDIKYKALHNFTANLPLLNSIEQTELIGNTTEKCIMSGIINGTIAEIEQTINLYKAENPDIKVVITGGSGEFILSKLKNNVTFEKNLIFWGLKNIYDFNETQNK